MESIKAICGMISKPLVETISISPEVVDETTIDTQHQIYNDIDWVSIQHQDKEF